MGMGPWKGARKGASGGQADTQNRPMRLIYRDDEGEDGIEGGAGGKFVVGEEAARVLAGLDGPVGVVCVAGRARQGKSYLLNRLTGSAEGGAGFKVGSTHRACTKGLWMWGKPLQKVAPDGTRYNLVLLDTEGIDAYDQTGTYSLQIFSLAVLLSSFFVYNQMGGIDEVALDRLSLVVEMTKHIKVKAGKGETVRDLGRHAPQFLWLLRDFYLQLNEGDGTPISPAEYLESVLLPVAGTGPDVAPKNKIRQSIKDLFPRRQCHTLVRPVNNEAEIQRLDTLPAERLRPEFRAGMDALTNDILDTCRPKALNGRVLSGGMFVELCRAYIDALNKGAVPTIYNAWQSISELECLRAKEAAMEAYDSAFDREGVEPDEASLQEMHTRAMKAAMRAFRDRAIGDDEVVRDMEGNVKDKLSARFKEIRDAKLLEAERANKEAMASFEGLLAEAVDGAQSLEDILGVLAKVLREYDRTAVGPKKHALLVSFLQDSFITTISDWHREHEMAAAEDKAALERKVSELTARLASAETTAVALREEALRMESSLRLVEAEGNKRLDEGYLALHESMMDAYNAIRVELKDRHARFRRDVDTWKVRCSEIAVTNEQLERKVGESARAVKQLKAEVSRKEKESARIARKLDASEHTLAELNGDINSLIAQVEESKDMLVSSDA